MRGGEVDFTVEVHEVIAVGHSLRLLEVSAVRDAVNLMLSVLGIFCHSHRCVHFNLCCFQLVVNLVHMLFKSTNFVAFEDVLVQGKDDFGQFVLSLFLDGRAQNDLGQSVGIRDVHTCPVC